MVFSQQAGANSEEVGGDERAVKEGKRDDDGIRNEHRGGGVMEGAKGTSIRMLLFRGRPVCHLVPRRI